MGLRNWVSSLVGSEGPPQEAAPAPMERPAPPESKLAELARVAKQARSLAVSAEVRRDSGEPIQVDVRQSSPPWAYGSATGKGVKRSWHNSPSFADALAAVAKDVQGLGRLDLGSVTCRSGESPVRGTKLKDLCIAALCEAFGEAVPSSEDLARRREAARAEAREKGTKAKARRKELLALLASGTDGVAEWNRRRGEAEAIAPLRKVDLAGKDLSGAHLVAMPEGQFAGAILVGADLRGGDFRKADFTGANLEGVELTGARVQGADFRGARLAGALWKSTQFDETTAWPEGFALPEELQWTGQGPSPAALAAIAVRKRQEGPIDLGAFMKRLEATIEKARMSKALSMLKNDRFQLFVEATDARLAGVVKSQSDPDLVYSCLLSASGAFSCCTQNLNVCGGLRGALCKHLLVLIVGVAQAGEVSADTLDDWVQRSTLHQPTMQKDAQSAILLRYKGAEAGEIDWRPTETVPEDFYAY